MRVTKNKLDQNIDLLEITKQIVPSTIKSELPDGCNYMDLDDEVRIIASRLFDCLHDNDHTEIVIVCFGTSNISGDALGPRVGSMLVEKYNIPTFVYGTEDRQINGKNMRDWLAFIKQVHEGALFISIDASLGSKDKIGQIVIRDDGVCPSGVTGKKERFGDIGILGVVAQKQGDAIMQLLSVSPLYVDKLADKICVLLNSALG